jgi:hypothetical protein
MKMGILLNGIVYFIIEFYLSEKLLVWETGNLQEATAAYFELRSRVVDLYPKCLCTLKPKEISHIKLYMICYKLLKYKAVNETQEIKVFGDITI